VHLSDDALEETGANREVLEQPLDAQDLVAFLRALVDRLENLVLLTCFRR